MVLCVDAYGGPVGQLDVVSAHTAPGTMHLACSAVVFGPDDTVLVQRRADHKPTFAGQWSNTCCTHPFPQESPHRAAERRLTEELGISVSLRPAGLFRYRAVDEVTTMVEHELDHVFIGETPITLQTVPERAEVAESAWITLHETCQRIERGDPCLTPWFAMVMRLACAARTASTWSM